MNWYKAIFSKKVNQLSYCPSPIIIISEQGRILFANSPAEKLLETSILYNKSIVEFFDVELDYFINKGIEYIPLKLNNKNKYVEIKSCKLPKKEEYIISLQDVTQEKISTENLIEIQTEEVEMQENKNVFLVKMANNIKSPLHSIIGFSQAILEGLGGDINEKQEKYLRIIHKNSSELLLMLEKIINLSQIEAKLYEYSYKNFDIVNTVVNIATEFKPKIEEKRLQLFIDVENIVKKPCYSDGNIIKIILGNLIENAILSCDIGSITVKLSNPSLEILELRNLFLPPEVSETAFVMLEVIDTGNGVQESEIADMFNPYVQVNKSSKKNVIRSLILAITKEFTTQLGGDIWVESELLKSSVYRIILPIEKG